MMRKRTFLQTASALAAAALMGTLQPALAETPDDLNIAVILSAGIESGWDGTLIDSLERVKTEKPHGLDISWTYNRSVVGG